MGLLPHQYSDKEIIAGLKAGGNVREKFETITYEKFVHIRDNGPKQHNLLREQCGSAYSEAIRAVIKNILNNTYEARGTLESYIGVVFKYKCEDERRKDKGSGEDGDIDKYENKDGDDNNPIDQLIYKEERENFENKLIDLGENCYQLLMRWFGGLKDKEIAKELGYKSAPVVRVTRSRCLNKLRDIL